MNYAMFSRVLWRNHVVLGLVVLQLLSHASGKIIWRKQTKDPRDSVVTRTVMVDHTHGNPYCRGKPKPHLPSYIKPMKINPYEILGKWYGYLYWNSYLVPDDGLPIANYVAHYRSITGATFEPASRTRALGVEVLSNLVERVIIRSPPHSPKKHKKLPEQKGSGTPNATRTEESQRFSENTTSTPNTSHPVDRLHEWYGNNQTRGHGHGKKHHHVKYSCFPSASLLYVTTEGRVRETFFVDYTNVSNTFVGMASGFILSTDYDSYMLYYECRAHDKRSGFCKRPYVSVLTRKRPDKVCTNTASRIADAVSRSLGRYCFSFSQMFTVPWITGLETCPIRRPEGRCYSGLRSSMMNLANPPTMH